MVQFWTVDGQPIECALHDAAIDASIVRADFEAAINAALVREHFDVAIFDPSTPDLTREAVEHCLRLHGGNTPLVVLEDPMAIGREVHRLLAPRRN